ncbi:MAG: L-histidine N(alpha)-methyltransferase [Pyrinomonadaceae bacterium]
MQSSNAVQQNAFAAEVLRGFSSMPKFLSSKYFYDDEGSRLFRQIMDLPEYYLTRSEFEIFSMRTREIYESFAAGFSGFDLIELGAGDGTKTAVLIDYFLRQKADFTYTPIDISQEAVDSLTENFRKKFPDLNINAKTGDYFRILESLKSEAARPKIILFLGSNIGNFSRARSIEFFKSLRAVMNKNDALFVGFDLQKDPRVILAAYDDARGVTAKFNLNLLNRINRELGANFDTEKFSHYAIYRPTECAARSFLISRASQKVFIGALNQTFDFKQGEPVFMEISQKYSLEMIEDLALTSGFRVAENFFDGKKYFADSLWKTSQNHMR